MHSFKLFARVTTVQARTNNSIQKASVEIILVDWYPWVAVACGPKHAELIKLFCDLDDINISSITSHFYMKFW
jgi:hypothetical protein